MKTVATQDLIDALRARMKEIKHEGNYRKNGCKGELSTQQTDDCCALFSSAGRLKDSYTVRVSLSWLTGSGLGDVYDRARHGDHGAQEVVDVINRVFKEAE
ncbi:MAG: hypothetical protein IJ164_04270 [Duodenibacillus sp.]|nr:hypothetical protein [Duodenibacillus sp.]